MLVHHLKGGRVESLAFGPDGRSLVVPRPDDGVLVWADIVAGGAPRALPRIFTDSAGNRQFDNPHGRVRLSADGRRVGCRGWYRPVVYDLDGGPPVPLVPEIGNVLDCAALTPAGDGVVFSLARPRYGIMTDMRTFLSLRSLADPRPIADRWALALDRWVWDEAAFLTGDRFVSPETMVLESPSRWVASWVVRDLATGHELAASPPLGRRAAQATTSPDGRWVAGIHTKHLVVWSPADPSAPPLTRKNDGPLHFTGVAFHPSGAYLATTSNDATVRLYDTGTWEVARTYAWQAGKLRCVAFSPDGMLAAVGTDSGNIVVWDVDL